MIAITVIMTMKLMMIMTLMANTLPVVTHQLVSQSALKSEEEVGPSNVTTIIKKLVFVSHWA